MARTMPHEHNYRILKATKASLRYSGGDFALWQKQSRAKLAELTGIGFFEKCDPQLNIEYQKQCDGFTEYRFVFQSEQGYTVPCHLLVPDGAKTSLPVFICLQGHSTGMHISLGRPKFEGDEKNIESGDRNFAVRAVKEGFCALVLEQRSFGERGGDPRPTCYSSSMTALLTGRTAIAERVWDVSRAIDVLEQSFPQVDCTSIACMGNSGGGTATVYAAALDERIKLAVPSCSVCTYAESIGAVHHCACNYIPSIARYFDMGDVCGLIAPRKLVVVAGKLDGIFPIDGVNETYAIISELYRAAGCEDNCALVVGEEGHRFYADLAWPVMLKMLGK